MFLSDNDYAVVIGEAALKVISHASPENIVKAETEAIEEISGYLRPVYDTDAIFSAQGKNRNPIIVMRTADITLYHLAASLPPLKKFGIRIPVMAGYHFDFTKDIKVSVFTGPELEIGFSGKEYINGHNIEMSESIYGDNGGMNRVNVLWGIGAGISYQHFYFSANGGIGMLNMLSGSDAKFHENRVTFSVGYNF